MAILIKPSNILKGVKNQFTLTPNDILPMVNDTYFSDMSNWSNVVISWKSLIGNQSKVVAFSMETLTGDLKLSLRSRNEYRINRIIINDFDGSSYIIDRQKMISSGITISELDLTIS